MKKERSRCECGGDYALTRVWDNTYEIRCNKCGAYISYFTSKPQDAEANAYLLWLEVLNEKSED